jgi:Ankyrin repeats (3 copies)
MIEQAKIKFSLDLFEILRSDDCIKAKDIIGEALKPVKSSKSKPVVTELTHRLGFIRELLLNQPLLHCCVNDPSSRTDSDATDSPADGKIVTAQYLLELRSDLIDLGIRDEDGRTALHLAAKKEDNAFLKLLLSAREETIERRAQLDINARCGKSGWTVLHYAAGQGDITAVRLLMKAGATLTVQATVGKAVTPLDLVKTRLQNAGHFSASHIANLQLVSTEISEAIQNQDRMRQQKEAEMLLKEEKLEIARKITAEREEKERELLLRKQKQLKDKQEKDRSRDSIGIEEGKKSLKSSSGASTAVGTSSVTKLSSKESLGSLTAQSSATVATSQSPILTPSVTASPSIDLTDSVENSKSAKKKKKKDKKLEQELELEVSDIANASRRVTVVDVASRDELVDHLLAMGFDESDCFSAVSLFGRDLDRSLSWLCDRPAVKSDIDDQVGSATATARGHGTSSSAGAGTGDSSDGATPITEGSLTQRDNDLPSQLRSVNRAWNLKAEDEKKRVSACTEMNRLLHYLIHHVLHIPSCERYQSLL